MTTAERFEFQAEVRQLLDLLVHSLYSNKDIFLRELVSNASDALDKLRFAALTEPGLMPEEDLHIRLVPDPEGRTLSVIDNGIGMNRDEVVQNIGTIARSGTMEFMEAIRKAKEGSLPPELIGQFGVGFYSSFMAAERVTVATRRAGETTATQWESTGDGAYTVEETEREGSGTTVTLHLRPTDAEDGLQDYTAEWVLKEIVKRHSDFVSYPIKMRVSREEVERDEEGQPRAGAEAKTVVTDETLNSMQAIWTRPKDEVTEEEYKEFYKYLSHDWTDPLTHLSVSMEGAVSARALLYVPSVAPFDLYHREMSYRGLQLYIRRVFIMDECQDLMPPHLRFIKGVVDSEDLTLNVSREILQRDRKIAAIRKFLVRKVLDELARLKRERRDDYLTFWRQFGPVVKEGLLGFDEKKDTILDLVLCSSSRDETELTSLADYVSRMPADQPAIYYMTGPSVAAVRAAPQIEAFLAKGYEVLFFVDRVDDVWLQNPPPFQEKEWRSVGRGAVELGGAEEQKSAEEDLKTKAQDFAGLLTYYQQLLDDDIKEVRVSNRLTTSPACLVGEVNDLSPQIAEIMRQMGQEVPKTKRILEVNPSHPILRRLHERYEAHKGDPEVRKYARLLFGQAVLAEGGSLEDPTAFSKQLAEVMEKGL